MATKKATTRSTERPEHKLLAQLLAKAVHLTDAQRAAYQSLHSNEDCAALGSQTISARVLREGVTWASMIAAALTKLDIVGYPPARFAFFLEQLLALDTCIERTEQRPDRTAPRAQRDASADALKLLRDDLLGRIDHMIGSQTDLRAELAEISGAVDGTPELLERANGLRALLADWLERKGVLEVLLPDFKLDADALAALDAAIARLQTALLGTMGQTPLSDAHDAPDTNVFEGRVLYEMRTVMKLFKDAREKGVSAPVLMPTSATSRVLASRPKRAKSQPAEPTRDAGSQDGPAGSQAAPDGSQTEKPKNSKALQTPSKRK